MTKQKTCIDCGTNISKPSTRCCKCANKFFSKSKKYCTTPWNKGLTIEDPRVAKNIEAMKRTVAAKPKVKRVMVVTPESHERRSAAKRGDKNPAKRPEVREKIRNSILTMYKEHPEVLANRKRSGKNQFSDYYTSIERKIADELHKQNVYFQHNVKIGPVFADFLIFDKVVIECDGEYWHQDEAKDHRKDMKYFGDGYFVFRLPEKDINIAPDVCVKNIIEIMSKLDSTVVSNIMGIRFEYSN